MRSSVANWPRRCDPGSAGPATFDRSVRPRSRRRNRGLHQLWDPSRSPSHFESRSWSCSDPPCRKWSANRHWTPGTRPADCSTKLITQAAIPPRNHRCRPSRTPSSQRVDRRNPSNTGALHRSQCSAHAVPDPGKVMLHRGQPLTSTELTRAPRNSAFKPRAPSARRKRIGTRTCVT